MKAALLLLLSAALTGPATGLSAKKHIFVDTSLSWPDARKYCRANHVDLSTISTPEELQKLKVDIRNDYSSESWIGLYKNESESNFTRWSDGSWAGIGVSWESSHPKDIDEKHCVTIKNGELYNQKCKDGHKFICYSWDPELTVVEEKKTWDEAFEHCKMFDTDLISVPSQMDRFVNNRSLYFTAPAVWAALRFLDGSWFWVNNKTRANIPLLSDCPIWPFVCGARKTRAEVWENRDCGERLNFMCYKRTI